jgi:hypothetical protein
MSGGAASHTLLTDALPPSDSDVLAVSPYFGSRSYDAPRPAWTRPPPTFMQRVIRTGRSTWRKVNDFMTPPLWASVLSLVVALNQPLQYVLGVQLRPFRDAITQAGDCSIPLTLVVLGAYFHRPPDKSELPSSESNAREASLVGSLRKIFCLDGWKEDGPSHAQRARNSEEGKTVFVSILARMVVVPALLLPLVVFSRLQGYPQVIQECAPLIFQYVEHTDDILYATSPIFILSNVLLMASPPALTLAQVGHFSLAVVACSSLLCQITQVTSDAFERLISRTIFWSYCVVAPPAMVGFALIAMLIARL